jgi:hypothetical protein
LTPPNLDERVGDTDLATVEAPMSRNVYSWLLGLAALMFPPIIIAVAGPSDSEDWLPVYWAGAIGGLALELFAGGWGLELPSSSRRRPSDMRWAPFGPWHDLGFLGRMITGAIAAPVFLVVVNVLGDNASGSDLAAQGDDLENLAWGVLIGAASPTAWKLAESLVSSRIGMAQQQLSSQITESAENKLAEAQNQLADPNITDTQTLATLAEAKGQLGSARAVLAGAPDVED